MEASVVAWKVYAAGYGPEPVALGMASTRSQVIRRNLGIATGAGAKLSWADFRAIRAPEYDDAFVRHGMFNWTWKQALSNLGERESKKLG